MCSLYRKVLKTAHDFLASDVAGITLRTLISISEPNGINMGLLEGHAVEFNFRVLLYSEVHIWASYFTFVVHIRCNLQLLAVVIVSVLFASRG
jgi:hypothetical protein